MWLQITAAYLTVNAFSPLTKDHFYNVTSLLANRVALFGGGGAQYCADIRTNFGKNK